MGFGAAVRPCRERDHLMARGVWGFEGAAERCESMMCNARIGGGGRGRRALKLKWRTLAKRVVVHAPGVIQNSVVTECVPVGGANHDTIRNAAGGGDDGHGGGAAGRDDGDERRD